MGAHDGSNRSTTASCLFLTSALAARRQQQQPQQQHAFTPARCQYHSQGTKQAAAWLVLKLQPSIGSW
eukprot:4580271-Amphidinium_carterae.1